MTGKIKSKKTVASTPGILQTDDASTNIEQSQKTLKKSKANIIIEPHKSEDVAEADEDEEAPAKPEVDQQQIFKDAMKLGAAVMILVNGYKKADRLTKIHYLDRWKAQNYLYKTQSKRPSESSMSNCIQIVHQSKPMVIKREVSCSKSSLTTTPSILGFR